MNKTISLQIVTLNRCGSCKSLKNEIESIKEKLEKEHEIILDFVDILDASNKDIYKWAKSYNIERLPTTLIIHEGVVKKLLHGFINVELYINSLNNFFLCINEQNKIEITKYE